MDQDLPRQSLAARIREHPVAQEAGRGRQELAALKERTAEAGTAPVGALDDERVQDLLAGTLEHSPYLSTLINRDPQRLLEILSGVPEEVFEDATARLAAEMDAADDMAAAKRGLRQYKALVALLSGLADLGGVWPVMTVTRVLSLCADAAVAASVRFLFRRAVAAGQWQGSGDAPELTSGYFVLAMGKHGAYELNYSSDIDLIVFFDRERATFTGRGDLQSFFVRLTRDLVLLLEDRTPDGYVFRTDLRLRPDAGATQVALSTVAAHGYYESVGQNWERAAMIKARPCGGDIAAGQEFLDALAPFIWRKYLDFAAIADVHAMKRQIHAHRDIGDIAVLGQNVKLGRGGIREIEFFAQTQQLIAGGRQRDLRVRGTLEALAALEARGWVRNDVRTELHSAYLFLRRLEHRLQMIADEQTHEMPADEAGLDTIAKFSGYADGAALAEAMLAVLRGVEGHYESLFEGEPQLSRAGSNMVFAGATDDPDTVAELKRLGYSQPEHVLHLVRGWHHGRTPAVRSARARERLTEVQPLLIAALADTVDPDAAIASFDSFLAELPAGVQLFSLLKANPALLRLLADIMGSAPRLARILSRRRRLLEAVLDPLGLDGEMSREALDAVIATEFASTAKGGASPAMQDILDGARIVGSEQMFLVGIGLLTGSIEPMAAGAAYARIAEALIAALLDAVVCEMRDQHGTVAGGEAVVVAMGKLGGREMTASSDVDLIVIYDFEEGAQQSDGSKPLAPSHYFTRLTQRLVNAISAPTAQGSLFEVDMRLRPSGQKGPVATKLSSFASYQQTEAWTWEHLALTRARVIAGSPGLAARVEATIAASLAKPRDRGKIAADVRDMRALIAAEKGTLDIWDIKQVRGGLVDLEFIAQYLQLVSASDHPGVLQTSTLSALGKLAEAGVLARSEADGLCAAGELLHATTQIVRLCLDQPMTPARAPAGFRALLAKRLGMDDFEFLESRLEQELSFVAAAFDRLVV